MTNFPESGDTGPVRVKAGHAAVFTFPSITSEPSPSVSWQSEDNSLLYGTKYAVTRDNSLVILDVDKGDEKRYRWPLSSVLPDITPNLVANNFLSFHSRPPCRGERGVTCKMYMH